MGLLNTILDMVFPAHCASCGKRGEDLCPTCLLGFPTPERETAGWIFSLYDYRHKGVKDAIWVLKYKGRRNIARILAKALYPRILEELGDLYSLDNFREPLLVPVPLSPARRRERGFNQAELITRKLFEFDRGENFMLAERVLIKPRDTEHQARIRNKNERLKNVVGSFAVNNSGLVEGKNVILIDDVTTTGATLKEAKKVLKLAGAKKIIAFTIAH